jgi:hypothetical protein
MADKENEKHREEQIKKNPMKEDDVRQNPEKGKMRDPYKEPNTGGEHPTKPKGDKNK